jgi:hypothetical protein
MAGVPLRSQQHVDQLLSNVAVKYKNDRYIHDKVCKTVPVKKSSDLYRTYNRQWSIPETNRAVGGLAREHQFEIGTSSYSLEKHALKMYVPDSAVDNYDLTSLEADATEELVEKIMMRKEQMCAALFTTTAWSLGVSLAAADTWVTSTATPIPLHDTATATVVQNSGVKPNFEIIPLESYNALKNHATVIDRIKYTSKELSPGILGALLGVSEILVPDMQVDSGLYGASAASGAIASLWKADFAFLGYKPDSAGMFKLASMYEFAKAKPLVRKWRDEEREATAIEVDIESTFKVVASLTGYYINNTI